jgi:hypothetical protein
MAQLVKKCRENATFRAPAGQTPEYPVPQSKMQLLMPNFNPDWDSESKITPNQSI